jgi:ADP-ribose pyrophosphatase
MKNSPHTTHIPVVNETSTCEFNGFFKINKYVFDHKTFTGGVNKQVMRLVFERGQAAAILPYDPETDSVLLIQQFLIGAHVAGLNNRPLQVIAGMIDKNQTPEDTARREALEEAGCEPTDLIKGPAFLPSPGGTSEVIHTFIAKVNLDNAGGTFGLVEEDEDIFAMRVPAQEAIRMLDDGEIMAGPAVVLLSFFARHHARLKSGEM